MVLRAVLVAVVGCFEEHSVVRYDGQQRSRGCDVAVGQRAERTKVAAKALFTCLSERHSFA